MYQHCYWTIAGRHHASHWRRDVCLHLRAQVRREADHLEPAGPGDPHTRLQHQEGVFVHGPPTYIVHVRSLNRKRDRSYPRECLHGSVLALSRGFVCGSSIDNVQATPERRGVARDVYTCIVRPSTRCSLHVYMHLCITGSHRYRSHIG